MAEARYFLSLPPPVNPAAHDQADHGLQKPRASTTEAARRLFATSRPLDGTLAETYLRTRGLVPGSMPALRFHPAVLYRDDEGASPRRLPAMVAAVTDAQGRITGVQRTWLAADGHGLARLPSPRRALGQLLGHGVRFGPLLPGAPHQLIAGEGIETVLSVHSSLPDWHAVAALSAGHLAAFEPPPQLARLAIALDADDAGRLAAQRLRQRAETRHLNVIELQPCLNDFNQDLCCYGLEHLQRHLRQQIGSD